MSSLPIVPVTVASVILILSLMLWWTVVQRMFRSPKPASQQSRQIQTDQTAQVQSASAQPEFNKSAFDKPKCEKSELNKPKYDRPKADRSESGHKEHGGHAIADISNNKTTGKTEASEPSVLAAGSAHQLNSLNDPLKDTDKQPGSAAADHVAADDSNDDQNSFDQNHEHSREHGRQVNIQDEDNHSAQASLNNTTPSNIKSGNGKLGNGKSGKNKLQSTEQYQSSAALDYSHASRSTSVAYPLSPEDTGYANVTSQSIGAATATPKLEQQPNTSKSSTSTNSSTEKNNTTQYRTAAKTNNALSRSEAKLQISTHDTNINPRKASGTSNITPIKGPTEKAETPDLNVHSDPVRNNTTPANRIGKQSNSKPSTIELALSKQSSAQTGNDTVERSEDSTRSTSVYDALTESQLRAKLADSEDMVNRLQGALVELRQTRQQQNLTTTSGTSISPSASGRPTLLSKVRILDNHTV